MVPGGDMHAALPGHSPPSAPHHHPPSHQPRASHRSRPSMSSIDSSRTLASLSPAPSAFRRSQQPAPPSTSVITSTPTLVAPAAKSIKRGSWASLQGTLRHVSSSARKGKEKEKVDGGNASASNSAFIAASRARSTTPTPRDVSPSPTRPIPTPIQRRSSGSASTSHLPLASSSPPSSPRVLPRRASHGAESPVMGHRHNASLSSLGGGSSGLAGSVSPEREAIRKATAVLVKEIVNRRNSFSSAAGGEGGVFGKEAWGEIKSRMRSMIQWERMWSRGGSAPASGRNALVSPSGSSGSEDRERRMFGDALKDGYVLCQFMNKLKPLAIPRPDPAGNTQARRANVTKLLAAASSFGVQDDELFGKDDLREASAESLARVARTVLAMARIADEGGAASSNAAAIKGGRGGRVYAGKGASWTPNLLGERGGNLHADKYNPPLPTVPAEGETIRPPPEPRISIATSATGTTQLSSLLEPTFGTIRTVNTEATSFMPYASSDAPSLTRTEASSVAESAVSRSKRKSLTLSQEDLISLKQLLSPNTSVYSDYLAMDQRKASYSAATKLPDEYVTSNTIDMEGTVLLAHEAKRRLFSEKINLSQIVQSYHLEPHEYSFSCGFDKNFLPTPTEVVFFQTSRALKVEEKCVYELRKALHPIPVIALGPDDFDRDGQDDAPVDVSHGCESDDTYSSRSSPSGGSVTYRSCTSDSTSPSSSGDPSTDSIGNRSGPSNGRLQTNGSGNSAFNGGGQDNMNVDRESAPPSENHSPESDDDRTFRAQIFSEAKSYVDCSDREVQAFQVKAHLQACKTKDSKNRPGVEVSLAELRLTIESPGKDTIFKPSIYRLQRHTVSFKTSPEGYTISDPKPATTRAVEPGKWEQSTSTEKQGGVGLNIGPNCSASPSASYKRTGSFKGPVIPLHVLYSEKYSDAHTGCNWTFTPKGDRNIAQVGLDHEESERPKAIFVTTSILTFPKLTCTINVLYTLKAGGLPHFGVWKNFVHRSDIRVKMQPWPKRDNSTTPLGLTIHPRASSPPPSARHHDHKDSSVAKIKFTSRIDATRARENENFTSASERGDGNTLLAPGSGSRSVGITPGQEASSSGSSPNQATLVDGTENFLEMDVTEKPRGGAFSRVNHWLGKGI